MLCHYLDNFVTIFQAKESIAEKMSVENKVYILLTNFLDVPQNNSKSTQGTLVIVFGIEIDTPYFTAHLPKNKLKKVTRANTKILSQKSVNFIDIQSLKFFLVLLAGS